MMLPESRWLKNKAGESVSRAGCDPRKLVLFHTAVTLVLSLLGILIDFVLEHQIGNTTGLRGVELRAVLETVRTVLWMAQIIALPFWQVGWLYATVKIARCEDTGKKDLLEGFRRLMPFLRLTVLKGLIFSGLIFGGMYVAAFVVSMLPMAGNMMAFTGASLTEAELMAMVEPLMVPMMIIGCVLALAFCIPFFYRFRMAEYVMLDNRCGARASLRGSRVLMKGNLWKLMKLDLSFWWFWLLTVAISVLNWSDILLPAMGISLPWSESVSYLLAYLLAAAAQLVLYYFCRARMDVTYAHAYLSLLPKEEETYESH